MRIIYILALLFAATSNFILIGILSKRQERSVMIASFTTVLLLVNTWAISQLAINLLPVTEDVFIAIDKVAAFGYAFIPIAYMVFALAFTDRLSILRSHIVLFLFIAPSIIFLFLAWNTNLIESREFAKVTRSSWGYVIPTGTLFSVFFIWFEVLALIAMGLIFRFYRTTLDIVKKKQAIWVLVATSIPFLFGTFTNGILPIFHIRIFPLAIPLTSIMALIITYAVFRYELFELSPRTILSSIGNGIITVNMYEKIIHMNAAAKEVLRLYDTNWTNKPFYKVISMHTEGHRASKTNRPLSHVLQTGEKILSSDYFMSTSRKKNIPVGCTITPIKHRSKIVGATIVFRDITQEKELEKSKNEFISIASHELKTPITSIKGFSQILQAKLQQNGDTKSRYFIANINEQLNKITTLINDLLNISRIEEGRFILHKKKFDINELVQKVVTDFQYTTESHHITKKGNSQTIILADEERIHQVLINLLTNAIKYSPQANTIVVQATTNADAVIVSVQDFGIGISKKDQSNVFSRFYRSRESGGENITGFGLGLYICAEIIKRHNGKIWVESTQGKGSTFSFMVPIR